MLEGKEGVADAKRAQKGRKGRRKEVLAGEHTS